jgi:hypothetical protein
MSRRGWILLALVALLTIVGLVLGSDPDQAGRLAQMRREAAFTGESREMVLVLLAFGIGGFIIYLPLTRR